ncbi:MAG: hypothetical protein AAGC46_20140 [Solirubrobacteraceae bacterium]|nr:hypothetical protein [Patulibacter sp.]
MPDPTTFHDLPILGELGLALDEAMTRETATAGTAGTVSSITAAAGDIPGGGVPAGAPRRARWWRRPGPLPAIVVALLLGGLGTSTAAATLTVLRGSPIPVPRKADVQPLMTPKTGTATVLPVRAPHLGAGAPFALRTSRSETGLTCVTVGQSSRGRFGITGTDGHFRELPGAIVNGCGQLGTDRPAALGARVFEDRHYAAVRSVVYGVAGTDLRRAEMQVRGAWSRIPATDGAFVAAVRGYPEDSALRVRLTYASGKRVEYPLGISYSTVTDPSGPAWRFDVGGQGGIARLCLGLGAFRPSATTARGPQICGQTKGPRNGTLLKPYILSIRTLHPGETGGPPNDIVPGGRWAWKNVGARTVISGIVDRARIANVLITAGGARHDANLQPGGGFVAVLPGSVPASSARVTFVPKHGHPSTLDHDANLASQIGDHR